VVSNSRHRTTRNVVIITAITNALLMIIKIIVGVIGHSHALVADGIHSFSDLITDALIYFASLFGNRAADAEHPYGHARIETAATVGLALMVILAGLGIAADSGYDLLFEKHFATPDKFVLLVAAISIVANEWLYRFTIKIGNKIDSNLLRANAWHNRSDAASSLVVLLGVTGALLGFPYLDTVAAIIVGLMIVRMGWGFGWKSICELIDTGAEDADLQEIRAIISDIPGIISIHQLRTRSMGGKLFADIHVLVAPYLSVSEGHYIGEQVIFKLKKKFNKIIDITIHVDPENDEVAHPNTHLPPRTILEKQLKSLWKDLPTAAQIKNIRLHYLSGKVQIEIELAEEVFAAGKMNLSELTAAYTQATQSLPYVASVSIFVCG